MRRELRLSLSAVRVESPQRSQLLLMERRFVVAALEARLRSETYRRIPRTEVKEPK